MVQDVFTAVTTEGRGRWDSSSMDKLFHRVYTSTHESSSTTDTTSSPTTTPGTTTDGLTLMDSIINIIDMEDTTMYETDSNGKATTTIITSTSDEITDFETSEPSPDTTLAASPKSAAHEKKNEERIKSKNKIKKIHKESGEEETERENEDKFDNQNKSRTQL